MKPGCHSDVASHIIESSCFPLANWLHLSLVAQSPCLTHDCLIYHELVHYIVHVLEEIEVGSSNSECWQSSDSPISEEVR